MKAARASRPAQKFPKKSQTIRRSWSPTTVLLH